ncbi:hypothetical protein ACWCXH_26205 [Kitasatospora sp. NPDC001660]
MPERPTRSRPSLAHIFSALACGACSRRNCSTVARRNWNNDAGTAQSISIALAGSRAPRFSPRPAPNNHRSPASALLRTI